MIGAAYTVDPRSRLYICENGDTVMLITTWSPSTLCPRRVCRGEYEPVPVGETVTVNCRWNDRGNKCDTPTQVTSKPLGAMDPWEVYCDDHQGPAEKRWKENQGW